MGWFTVAAPSHYLIITGLNVPDMKVEKEAFILPLQYCRQLDIRPVNYTFDVQAMSVERLPFTLSVVFSIGPRDDIDSLKRFAKSDMSASEVTALIKGVVERQAQLLAAGMPMEQVLEGTREFLKELLEKVQRGLDQNDLHIYNANITQLVDSKGKITQEEAANQVTVDEGKAEEIRTTPEADAFLHHERAEADGLHYSEQRDSDTLANSGQEEVEVLFCRMYVGEAEEITTTPETDAFLHHERAEADALDYSEQKDADTLANSKQEEVEGAPPTGELYAEDAYSILPQAEVMPGTELEQQLHASGRWDDLPVQIVAIVLSKTTPRDVCRLATVSMRFAEAASTDQVWKAFLPADVEETLQAVQDGAPVCRRVKDLYNHLTNHAFLGHGTAGYFIDRGSGGVCRTFSARTLEIVWGDDRRYWQWVPSEGSRFREVAFLDSVCWLHVHGTINCRVPPGTYTLSWVLKFDSLQRRGWSSPITFFSTDETQVYENVVPQKSHSGSVAGRRERRRIRTIADEWSERQDRSRDGWWEYNVGSFTVTKINEAENLGELHLRFEIKEIKAGNWKGGLYIDGVIVRSTLTT